MTMIADVRAAMSTNPIFTEQAYPNAPIPKDGGGWYASYESVDEERRIAVNVRLWACDSRIRDVEEVALGIALLARKALKENLTCALVGPVERAPDQNPTKIAGQKAQPTMFTYFATFDISVVGTPSGVGVS